MRGRADSSRPDEPAIIAHRLAKRLRFEGLICKGEITKRATEAEFNAIVEALADELHKDIVDRMFGGKRG